MKSIGKLLILVASLIQAGFSVAALPVKVQTVGWSHAAANTITMAAFATQPGAGSTIICRGGIAESSNTQTGFSVVDNGVTYSIAKYGINGSGNRDSFIVYRPNIAGGQTIAPVITGPAVATEINAVCEEWSGLTSSPLDKTGQNIAPSNWGTGGAGDTVTASAQNTNAGGVAIAVMAGRSNVTFTGFTTPAGYTLSATSRPGNGTPTDSPAIAVYKIYSSLETSSANFTENNVGNAVPGSAVAAIATFAAAPGPNITVQPTPQTVTAPAAATFTVTATASGGGTLSYQWKRDCSTNVGTNSSSYTTPATDGTYVGATYCVVVTETGGSSDGSATSSTVALTVNGAPTIVSVASATPANGTTGFVITGTNLKGTGASTVTLGGVAQTVTTQSATVPQITINRGTNCYGTTLGLIVTADNLGLSNTYSGITGITPQAGWSYVNLVSPGSGPGFINAVGALVTGNQIAYSTAGGLVTVNADASFVATSGASSFQVEVCVTASGWGTTATQLINQSQGVGGLFLVF